MLKVIVCGLKEELDEFWVLEAIRVSVLCDGSFSQEVKSLNSI